MRPLFRPIRVLAFAPVLLLITAPLAGKDAAVYRTPDPAVGKVVDSAPTPRVSLSPDETRMLLIQYPSYPPITELAEREL